MIIIKLAMSRVDITCQHVTPRYAQYKYQPPAIANTRPTRAMSPVPRPAIVVVPGITTVRSSIRYSVLDTVQHYHGLEHSLRNKQSFDQQQ